uniref:FBA_2 domain-containing protein n=1 Tax=Caenorhabditis tropicalis TaxID=1561998 RepID=A0A1I7TH92_9PELO
MDVFPLFQLPLVAMEHILSMMNPFEFELTEGIRERWSFDWTTDKSEIGYETNDSTESIEHKVVKYSENPIGDLMKWHYYIKEVLGCQFDSISFNLSLVPNQNRLISDRIFSHQASIPRMIIYSSRDESEDVKYLLNKIKSCDKLFLFGDHYEDNFHVEIPEGRSFLIINNAGFFNYEQLLGLKYQHIILRGLTLTNQEINGFLKSYIACESHLDLNTIEITIQSGDIMDVIMDIPHEETTDLDTLKKLTRNRFLFNDTKAYNIHRFDGKMASAIMTRAQDTFNLCLAIHDADS